MSLAPAEQASHVLYKPESHSAMQLRDPVFCLVLTLSILGCAGNLWCYRAVSNTSCYLCEQGQALGCQQGVTRLHPACGVVLQSLAVGESPCCGHTDSFMLEDVLVITSLLKLLENSIQCSLDLPLHAPPATTAIWQEVEL